MQRTAWWCRDEHSRADAFDVAETHRQHRLRTLNGLTLALLVHAQYKCVLRWTQVEAGHIAQFPDEELIGRALEAFAAMRLQTQQLEVPVHTRRRDGNFGCNRVHSPVRRVIRGLGVQGLVNQLRQLLIVDRARFAGAYLVTESVDALLQEPQTSLAHRGARELQAPRDRAVGLSVSRGQYDTHTRDQRSRNRTGTCYRHQLRALVFAQHQFCLRSSHRHIDVNMLREHRSIS